MFHEVHIFLVFHIPFLQSIAFQADTSGQGGRQQLLVKGQIFYGHSGNKARSIFVLLHCLLFENERVALMLQKVSNCLMGVVLSNAGLFR